MQSEANAFCSLSPANFGAYLRLCFPFGCPCKHRAPAVCFVAEMPLKPVFGGGNVPPGVTCVLCVVCSKPSLAQITTACLQIAGKEPH